MHGMQCNWYFASAGFAGGVPAQARIQVKTEGMSFL